ncbi:MAG: S9 family peptidase [Chloroflexi bacterium]|nr:S9 family peptidase [Chloroflexota bacterium]
MATPLTPATLVYGFTPASDPQLSPDGRHLLFTRTTTAPGAQPVSQVWLMDLASGTSRQLTRAEKSSSGARWSPDGRRIAFLSQRGEGTGIFLLEVGCAGDPIELTRHRTSVTSLAWSPDGTRLAYLALVDPTNPDEAPPPALPPVRVVRRIDYKQDDRGVLGDTRYQLFVLDVATGERRRLTSEPQDHFWPAWSPDGRWIATLLPNRNEMASQLALVPVAGGAPVLVGPEEGFISTFAWSPDGSRLVYTGDTRQTWQSDFFLSEIASGATRRVTSDLAVLPDGGFRLFLPPAQPVWLNEQQVLFGAFARGASGLYTIDLRSGAVEQLHAWGGVATGLTTDAACRQVAVGFSSFEQFGELARYDLRSGTMTLLTQLSAPVFAQSPPARHEAFTIERAGVSIDCWLLFPPDFDPARQYPLVLDVHGGPNGHYGPAFNPIQQCLATHGFLVLFTNPRGSSSYGRAFTLQVLRDWGGEDYRDLLAALDTVLERPYTDRRRVGIWGFSYGGYMTAWAITQSDRFAAAVCGAPCYDLRSMYGTSDIGHSFGDLHWGGPPQLHDDWYAAHSPSTFITRAKTPTLILHGEADERCPISQGEQLFIALKKGGCETEFVRYPNCSHMIFRSGPPAYREDFYRRLLDWFRAYLGDPPTSA